MTDLNELASRVEALDGPCRETDVEIMRALGVQGDYRSDFMGYDDVGHAIYKAGPKRYTASLDSAMTLVPEGWTWQITQWTDAADARVCQYNPGDIANGDATAATPALALCAAALRALASMEKTHEQD